VSIVLIESLLFDCDNSYFVKNKINNNKNKKTTIIITVFEMNDICNESNQCNVTENAGDNNANNNSCR